MMFKVPRENSRQENWRLQPWTISDYDIEMSAG